MDPRSAIRFDGWTLHRHSGELVKAGLRMRLQQQPLQVLEALLESPGDVVTREQLIRRLWPKGVVDFDTALNSSVRRLRTALGDHAETPRYIETIPRRGYRFIGTLDASAPEGGQPRKVRWPAVAMALLLLLATLAAFVPGSNQPREAVRGDVGRSSLAEARERYERAQYFFQRRASGDLVRAQEYFTEAIALDRGFARAWAGLAGVYWIETVEGRIPPEQGLAQVREAAERALALDPRLAEPHLRLATYRWSTGDDAAGDAHLRKALALDPDNPLVLSFSASIAAGDGRHGQAIELQRRAVTADPLSAIARHNLASYLYMAGRYDDARAELQRLAEVDPAAEVRSAELIACVLIGQGRFGEALEAANHLTDEAAQLHLRALAYQGSGRTAEADAALAALIEATRTAGAHRVAEVYAFRGDVDRAFASLQAASEQLSRQATFPRPGRHPLAVEQSPFLKPLHADPRWQAWVEG